MSTLVNPSWSTTCDKKRTKWPARTEVSNVWLIVIVQHDICRLDIVMRQSLGMEELECRLDLSQASFCVKTLYIVMLESVFQKFRESAKDNTNDATTFDKTSMVTDNVRVLTIPR
jgi:hypothetical protein